MILGAIPARWRSTRFPGKALAEIAGMPMVARVVQSALGARTLDAVVVVTDHEGIALAAEAAGARAVVIEREAASGTDRIAQLLDSDRACAEARIVVNVQGDEPLLEPEAIDAAVEALERDAGADIATVARRPRSDESLGDPDAVKVLVGPDGRARDFSRGPLAAEGEALIHIGLYAYRRQAIERFVTAPATARETAERLEQLRALELGLAIAVVVFDSGSIGVDTPADVARVEAALTKAAAR